MIKQSKAGRALIVHGGVAALLMAAGQASAQHPVSETPPTSTTAGTASTGATSSTGSPTSPQGAGAAATTSEVIVTASKRSESLLKTPQSVAVITGAQLEAIGALGFRDYIAKIPSLNFSDTGSGGARYNIRGIAALSNVNNDIATVGYYLDEIPISESGIGADIVPFDLQRIEVLRGPQGTLYGEGSIGGTIKVVTNKPDSDAFAGAAQASVSDTDHGGVNDAVSVMLNVPIVKDDLAIRFVGTDLRNSGYLDNIATGQNNVNYQIKDEERLALRWTPLSKLTVDVSGLLQYEHDGGHNYDFALAGSTVPNVENLGAALDDGRLSSSATLGNTAPAYSTVAAFPEKYTTHRYILNGTANYDFGWAQLLSSTSYYRLAHNDLFDSREDGQSVEQTAVGFGLKDTDGGPVNLGEGDRSNVHSRTEVISQEFRLTSPGDQPFRWLVGAFYRDRTNSFTYDQRSPDATRVLATLGVNAPSLFTADQSVSFTQYALFGEATYDITRKLHLTGGTRLFIEDVDGSGSVTILNTFIFSFPLLQPLSFPALGSQNQKDALFKASLAYDFTSNLHGYLLYSEGSRPGGLNQRLLTPYLPQFFKSDSTRNYEAGLKGAFLQHRLTASLSVFQIDWNNTQLYVDAPSGGQNIYNVPDGARVRGAELEASFKITPQVSVGGSYGYLDGKTQGPLTYFDSLSSPTTGVIPAGFELPNVPHHKGSAYVEYVQPVGGFQVISRLDDEYRSSTSPAFDAPYRLSCYNRLNAEVTLERDRYSLTVYANNLLDRIIEIDGPGATTSVFGIGIDRPRTVGLRLAGKF